MTARFLPATVRGRLALTYGLLGVLFIFSVGAYLILTVRGRYESRLEHQLNEQARMAASLSAIVLVRGAGEQELDSEIDQLGTGIETRLTIIDANGRVIADSTGNPGASVLDIYRDDTVKAINNSLLGQTGAVTSTNRNVMNVTVPVPGTAGAVARASTSLGEVDQAIVKFQRTVIAISILVIWGTLVVAFYVAGRITDPLDELRRHAALVAGGQMGLTVTPSDTQELGDLARGFNSMSLRVRDLIDEIEQSRARLEAIFANLSDGVILVDESDTVISMNASAARMLETRVSWAIGQPFVIAVRDADLQGLLSSAIASGEHREGAVDYGRTGRTFDAVAQPVIQGEEQLGIVVIRDVTELRRLELVRREFVANVSHELRTPLASIRALVETLEAGAIDDPTVANDFLGRVVGEVDRLTLLVDELLDLARLESGRLTLKLERMDPGELAIGGVERLRPQIERAGLNLVFAIEPRLEPIEVDRPRIEQVLVNLVHNAIKFTRPDGTITVRVRQTATETEMSIADTGVGIAPSELNRVFERFFKSDRARRSDGTGLGLAIAKHIVQAHGGTLQAESELGIGSCFTVILPTAPERTNLDVATNGSRALSDGLTWDRARPEDHLPVH